MKNNNYKTLSLFNDIEDQALRTRNRAVILANISEQYTKDRKITAKGASLVIGYFNEVPDDEKKEVMAAYEQQMKERGYGT